ncbi:MAG: ABC transporter permease, partial [Elusimicrobia bacterium]|nr:ABC transporter permease [Elusimicrobiota bacterium]
AGAFAGRAAPAPPPAAFSARRLLAYSARETKEILRDPIRCAFSLLGTVLLLVVFGYGITTDVENLSYAVLDRDRTPASRAYAQELAGSRYFVERPPLTDEADVDRRLRAARISLAVEIPPGFGRDLARGLSPEVSARIDGAMPFRAETIRGYVEGLHARYLESLAERRLGERPPGPAADLQPRFRYNQDFKSVFAMVPAVISLLLIFIPAILASLGVVREKELGSIVNAHVTPVTRLEFLLGKQLPYLAVGMVNFAATALLAVLWFGVPVKGSLAGLTLGALLYVGATTGLGLLVSTFTSTQIAALFASAVLTMVPAVQFSGMMQPVSSLEGSAAAIGRVFPTAHFMTLCLGAFTKGLDFRELVPSLLALAPAWPLIVALSAALLGEQER